MRLKSFRVQKFRNAGETITRYWAFARGGAWRNPKADRWPLRLRAMPPGRLRRKRQNPHYAGRHNNRAGPCGRVCWLRGAVVEGTLGGSIDGYVTWSSHPLTEFD